MSDVSNDPIVFTVKNYKKNECTEPTTELHIERDVSFGELSSLIFRLFMCRKCLGSCVDERSHLIHKPADFDVLLTVQHLSIFILVINQLDAQNLFYNKFISCLYMFRAPCAPCPMYRTATCRCDDTRGCIMQFLPPNDEHMVLETCIGMK